MTKISLASDFAKEISKSLGVTEKWVDEWFDIEEDKMGFFIAKLKPKQFLDKMQFRTMCNLVRDLGGESYLQGMKTWKVPGPYAKKAQTQETKPLPSTSQDVRSKTEPSGVTPHIVSMDKSKPPELTPPEVADEKASISLEDFEQKCVLCDATTDLVLHHKRYRSSLTKNDFVVLCRPCHCKLHIGGRGRNCFSLVLPSLRGEIEVGVSFGDQIFCAFCWSSGKVEGFDGEKALLQHIYREHLDLVTVITKAENERAEEWKKLR